MKIGIIAANNIRYSPYIMFYSSILDELGIDYELYIPQRNAVEDHFSHCVHTIPWHAKSSVIEGYIRYTYEVRKMLKKSNCDGLIVLTSNIAVFSALWLRKEYNQRYIVDIRDYSHEGSFLYRKLEKYAISGSMMNVISSRGFTVFLPQAEYHVAHNVSTTAHGGASPIKHDRIVIGYLGMGGYLPQAAQLAKLVEGDHRFELHFYGPQTLQNGLKAAGYSKECERIVFHGPFTPEQKVGILANVDVLFNVYGHGIPLLDYALSNKLYDALIFRKPILTSPNTYMSDYAGPLSYSMELRSTTDLNDLYAWYSKLDWKKIGEYAVNAMEKIHHENEATKDEAKKRLLSLLR